MQQWDKKYPGRLETMFTALQNIQLSHLADTSRYDFIGLKPHGIAIEEGDKAFDEEPLSIIPVDMDHDDDSTFEPENERDGGAAQSGVI